MGLSKLAAKCQACPFVDTCDHKRMEALGYFIPSVPMEQTTQRPEMDILQSSTVVEQIALQHSIAMDEIVRMAQRPFEESIRAYLSLIEKGIMTTGEVRKMRHLK